MMTKTDIANILIPVMDIMMNPESSPSKVEEAKKIFEHYKQMFKNAPSQVSVKLVGDRTLDDESLELITEAVALLKMAKFQSAELTITK